MLTGIIIGTGVDYESFLRDPKPETVTTPFGTAQLLTGYVDDFETVLVRRHGAGHTIPPHRINYRANIAALKARGVQRVLSTSAVGSMNPAMSPGHFCVPDDFIDWTRGRPFTFFSGEDGRVVHTDFTEPYCPSLRELLISAAEERNLPVHRRGTYACLDGPRYETPAEIRALARLGADIVGMTNATEAILCREAGLCFATLALVTNWAAGMNKERLDHEQVTWEMQANKDMLTSTLVAVVRASGAAPRTCTCGDGAAGIFPDHGTGDD